MNNVTISDISTPLKNYGSFLDSYTSNFHDSLFQYLEDRDFLHVALTGKLEEGKFCATMPKLKFFFNSRDKFVLYGRDLISEVEFFTVVNKEEVSLLKCYLGLSHDLRFESPTSDVIYNTEDENYRSEVFTQILTSAYNKKLISL
ncbi:hypothetical protein [Atlantibacter hermannii]|uniref:hypothetical protein n=1 Tax=Atlantibacter hermannii TaxID=565 RepID=UPI0028AB0313|nr:hypothetical protein [Atlantibacter hermannii]